MLGELLAEREEEETRTAALRAELAARRDPIPAGLPAVEGLSAFESLVAAGGVVTPTQEFGRPKPNFVVEEIEAGRKQAAELRAEAELLKKAQRVLDGRDKAPRKVEEKP